tara:strand:- start:1882 stop:2496 length:615 start_codon:yes stop_codon:yes gene_type:complete
MKLVEKYSHLNGYEWIQYHYPDHWDEIVDIINSVDAKNAKQKVSKEKTMRGKILYSPTLMNDQFDSEFKKRGWSVHDKENFVYIKDQEILKDIIDLNLDEQKAILKKKGIDFLNGNIEYDFMKNRTAVEVQFGKYSFVQYDIYAKFVPQFMNDKIDLGIEIVPMKSLSEQMSTGPTNYQKNLHEIIRQGRITPPIPFILIGIDT